MATSASVDFSLTRDNIIKMAYQKIGIVGEGGTPTSDQYTEGALMLNAITKSWNASLGMPLWALELGYILPIHDTNLITLGPSGGHATLSYTSTTLTADSAATDTTLTVSSITGISASDQIGIELDNGNIDWTTVNGAPSGTTVTITTGVTTPASSGNRVYAYTTKITRPLRILGAYTRDVASNNDVQMEVITSNAYHGLSSKTTESYPLQLHYEPTIDRGNCYIWPRFSNGDRVIVIHFHRPIEDFDASGDTPDFPQEWYLPLVYELACTVAPNYNTTVRERQLLRQEAKMWLDRVSSNDYEEGSIQFVPDLYRWQ